MLGLAPHAYYNVKVMMATKFKASNQMYVKPPPEITFAFPSNFDSAPKATREPQRAPQHPSIGHIQQALSSPWCPPECLRRVSLIRSVNGIAPLPHLNDCHAVTSVRSTNMVSLQIAGNMANLPSSELNFIAAEYLGARVLYTALYMGARSEFMSYMRTGVWAWSIALPLYGLVKAGKAMSEGDL